MKYLVTIILICAIGLFDCNKEESNNYTSQTNNLDFTKTEVSNGVRLSWDEARVSNFTEYVITKHTISRPAITSVADLNNLSSVNILARIKDRYIKSIIDTISLVKTYYRFYIVYGSQIVVSEEISQNPNLYILQSQNISQFLIDRRNGRLYLFFSFKNVEVIDLQNMKQINFFYNSYNLDNHSISLGYDQNGNTEIYSAQGDKILILDGESLNFKDTIYNTPKGKEIFKVATDQKNNIFFGEKDTLSKYDPLTKKITKIGSNNYYLNEIRLTNDGKTLLIGSTFSYVHQYNFDQNDELVSLKKYPLIFDFSSYSTAMANFEPELIVGTYGAIYTKDLHHKKNLSKEVEAYVQSVFDERDSIIYSIGTARNIVYKFENKNEYMNLGNFSIRSRPSRMFIYEGNLYIFGNTSLDVFSNKFVLEKVII